MVILAVTLACGGDSNETDTTETESTSGTETAPEVEAWAPTACTKYAFTPTDCEGTPENPSCHSEFTLRPDGTGVVLFDDIMAMATFSVSGDQVILAAPDHGYTETYSVVDDGAALLDATGNRYEASACD